MNREQAEHILDAYVRMRNMSDKDASDALREVILDAMTDYRSKQTTWPGITIPTDSTSKVTWTGIDPTFNTNTVSTVDGMAMAVGYQDGVVKVVGE